MKRARITTYIFCVYVWKEHVSGTQSGLSKTEETHRYFITFQDIADNIRLQKARGKWPFIMDDRWYIVHIDRDI